LVESAKYFKSAADQNHALAQFDLARCLRCGIGVEVDLIGAAQYFKLAADQNHAAAQLRYSDCLRSGEGIRIDVIESERYCKSAADHDFAPAQLTYGLCLIHGWFRIDFAESVKYFRLAAGLDDNLDGCHNLSFDESEFEYSIDPIIGRSLYSKAVECRCYSELNSLGKCFECGMNTAKDLTLAAECYSAAARQGLPDAQANYGFCVEHGLGVERNASECAEFYGKSADQKDAVGAGHYSLCLHFGSGFCDDLESAADYYELVDASQPSFLSENVHRCLRILNRPGLCVPVVKVEEAATVRDSSTVGEMPHWMSHYRVEPVSWERTDPLGKGSFGSVMCEADSSVKSGSRIAVKRLSPGTTSWEHFLREVEHMTDSDIRVLFGLLDGRFETRMNMKFR
jgi:TPR repeat protein